MNIYYVLWQVHHIEDVLELTGYELDSDSPYAIKSTNVTEQTQEVKVSGMKGHSSKVQVIIKNAYLYILFVVVIYSSVRGHTVV